jgi:hypothetical protein
MLYAYNRVETVSEGRVRLPFLLQFEMLRGYYIMCGNYPNALATYLRLSQTNDNFSHFVYAAEEVLSQI